MAIKYMGRLIVPCEWAPGHHDGRWLVVVNHAPTGVQYSDECCPHYYSLNAAKEAIKRA